MPNVLRSRLVNFPERPSAGVVFAGECHKAFSQADESDSECALVDNALYGLVGFQLVTSVP